MDIDDVWRLAALACVDGAELSSQVSKMVPEHVWDDLVDERLLIDHSHHRMPAVFVSRDGYEWLRSVLTEPS